jgi:hypothetical protein
MKLRNLCVIFLLAILMLLPAVASAQELDPCLGLSEADCDLINTATENTLATVDSFVQTFSIDFSVDDGTGTSLTFNLQGSGPVMGLSGGNPMFGAVMDVQFSSPDGDGSAQVEARLIDGVMYVRDTATEAWQSINLNETTAAFNDPNAVSGLLESAGLPFDPALLTGGGSGEMSEEDQAAMMAMMGVMGQAMTLVQTPGFLGYVRAGDDFTFTMDLLPLLNNPEFDALGESLSAGGEEMAQAAAALPMLKTLVQEGKLTVTQRVDTAATVVTGITFTTDFTVAAGENPVVLALVFNVDLSEVNGTFEIAAPDPATVTEIDMSGMMGGMMGGGN